MSRIFIPGVATRERATVGSTPEPTERQAFEMCCAFATVLTTIYPGHLWEVGMMQNIVYIKNLRLNKVKGYKIPLDQIDVEGKALMRIGGEILERFGQNRGGINVDSIGRLERNIRGDSAPQI